MVCPESIQEICIEILITLSKDSIAPCLPDNITEPASIIAPAIAENLCTKCNTEIVLVEHMVKDIAIMACSNCLLKLINSGSAASVSDSAGDSDCEEIGVSLASPVQCRTRGQAANKKNKN